MFRRILVPLDGSHLAESALPAALELASKFEGEITLIRVVASPTTMPTVDGRAYGELHFKMREHVLDEAEMYLKLHKNSLRQQGYVVHHQIVEGDSPAGAILDIAEAQNMDAIVMSTHGWGGLARWMFGSVADKIIRRADIPVVLIRANEIIPPIEAEADLRASELA
ncbi:MAG: universal stress protein [Ardenticatenaceae bacterium]|nr:universal stress protein [Ardenticatenaceae bacterium]